MRTKLADTLLVNGRFLTMEEASPLAQAVAIAGGRILYVGQEAEARVFADEYTEVIDLQNRVAAPGLIDCHTHIGSLALFLSRLNFRGESTKSLATILSHS